MPTKTVAKQERMVNEIAISNTDSENSADRWSKEIL